MRKKLLHRLAAGALSMVMALSVACVGMVPASAAGTTYTFAPSDVNLGADAMTDKAIIPEGTTFANGYIRVIGKVTQRYQDTKGGVYCVEVDKDQKGALEFTVRGTADVTVSAASTGGSNTSTVGLVNMADGSVVANKEGITTVTGTAATTLTYSGLAAGTYQVVSTITEDENMNRGTRIHGVSITEAGGAEGGGESVTVSYTFGPADVNLGADAMTDKAVIPEGTTYAEGFMKIIGKVTQRYQDTKGGVYCVEVDKDQKGAIEFTVTGTADVTVSAASTGGSNTSTVGLVNTGTGAVVPNNEGLTTVTGTAVTSLTYTGLSAGTYQVVSTITEDENMNRGTRIHGVTVAHTTSGSRADRRAWADVPAPAITGTAVIDGSINVTFDMPLGYDGADKVTVSMVDSTGAVVASSPAAQGSSVTMMPEKSDTYTFQITASRTGEADKAGAASAPVAFVLPLSRPNIASATSAGGGKVSVVWAAVPEATGYTLFVGGAAAASATGTEHELTGLAVGSDAVITVAAVRGEEVGPQCDAVTVKVTQDAKQVWNFARFGPSTNEDNNGFEGDLNNGKVTIYSEGGKGKIQPGADDGIAYYYTAVPEGKNFTLRANVHVDKWTYSNGQEGFGMLVRDSVPATGETGSHWSNQYMLMCSKVEYKYDTGKVLPATAADGTKFSMRLGIGTLAKLGLTPANYNNFDVKVIAPGVTYPLDISLAQAEDTASGGTYNIVGNYTNKPEGTVADVTDFVMEIQRNNTGYFLTYYDKSGNIIGQQKNYEPKALSVLDKDSVYVGFFASRNARITVSNAKFSTINPADDKPAEERPVTEIKPELVIASNSATSGSASSSPSYTLMVKSNVKGKADVSLNGEEVGKGLAVDGVNRTNVPLTIKEGRNYVDVTFTPSSNSEQGYDAYTKLASTEPMKTRVFVYYDTTFIDAEELYVAPLPLGKYNNTGAKDSPLDIYTAVKSVHPGQTIYLTEGVYYLTDKLEILRGMNGTEEKPIRMVIDPDAKARPVLDCRGGSGISHGGDWWYFGGFDVTNTGDGNPGFVVSGNHNVVDQVNAYHNGNTGIQIRRLGNSDTVIEEWPSNNLILNCTSYGNADLGYEDADGFACKQTAGEGNVFDGCVAYNNADDGFDLYANTGRPIGAVTIKNSIAYANGYLEDGTNAGNGNGFKMGGSSVAIDHKLINSFVFFNKAKGIDCNSCPNLNVENVTTYNNEGYNVALYTNNADNTKFVANGILSFKDKTIKDGLGVEENLKPKGNQDTKKYTGSTNYYWDGSVSQNSSGKKIGADAFVSLEFKGVTRNEDGTPSLGDFLKRSDKAPEKSGADGTGTASAFTAPQVVAVAANLPVATPAPTPEPTAEPTPAPTPAPAENEGGNGGVIGIVIAVIAAVAAVAGGGYYMTQKKKKDGTPS